MEDDDGDGSSVVPDQLCAPCRTLAAMFTQEHFWHAAAYKDCDKAWMPLDSAVLGPLADPVEHHPDLASLRRSAASGCHGNRLEQDDETDTNS